MLSSNVCQIIINYLYPYQLPNFLEAYHINPQKYTYNASHYSYNLLSHYTFPTLIGLHNHIIPPNKILKLHYLHLYSFQTDLSTIQHCTSLLTLTLHGKIPDMSPLQHLQSLHTLACYGVNLSVPSNLSNNTALKHIIIHKSNENLINTLCSSPNLKHVHINNCQSTAIISPSTPIKRLTLNCTPIPIPLRERSRKPWTLVQG